MKRVKERKWQKLFLYTYEYGTLKPVDVMLRRGRSLCSHFLRRVQEIFLSLFLSTPLSMLYPVTLK
jgi:hypothetical protein